MTPFGPDPRRACEPIEVPGSDGRRVRADVHGPAGAPTVIVAHGFKGFRAWGFFPWLCERLAAEGLRAVRLDYSHNGVQDRDFDRLDLFLLDTPERHQEDLHALAAVLPGPLGLLGHSRGGTDALLFAAAEPRVQAVVTLAAVASTRAEPPDLEERLRTLGYYPYVNARTGQTMPVARSAFESGRRLDLERAARTLACPVLLVHGAADESVPVADGQRLWEWIPRAERLVLSGTGHTFGAGHPFAGPTHGLARAGAAAADFLRRHLPGLGPP